MEFLWIAGLSIGLGLYAWADHIDSRRVQVLTRRFGFSLIIVAAIGFALTAINWLIGLLVLLLLSVGCAAMWCYVLLRRHRP